jgi:methyl-accepting chemotaxis protein
VNRLSARLIVAFAVFNVLVLGVWLVLYTVNREVGERTTAVGRDVQVALERDHALQQLTAAIAGAHRAIATGAPVGRPVTFEKAALLETLAEVRGQYSDAERLALLDRLEELTGSLFTVAEMAIDAARRDEQAQAVALVSVALSGSGASQWATLSSLSFRVLEEAGAVSDQLEELVAISGHRLIADLVLAFALVFGAVSSAFLIRSVAGPVRGLREAAQRIADGELSVGLPRYQTVEFDDLSISLGRMIESLTTETERNAATLAALPDAVVVVDGAERVSYANDPARRLFAAAGIDVDEAPELGRLLGPAGPQGYQGRLRVAEWWIDVTRRDLPGRQGDALVVLRDVTRQVEAEQALAAAAEDDRRRREQIELKVEEFRGFAQALARGELGVRLNEAADEFQDVTSGLNRVAAALQAAVDQVVDGAEKVATASQEILSALAQGSAGAAETGAAVAQTTVTLQQVRRTSDQTAEVAQSVSEAAARASNESAAGSASVEAVVQEMNQIKGRVSGIAQSILSLSERMGKIGEIVSSVEEISDQSNLLALNAAIEAARAGEAGAGFAVVAKEVGQLAAETRRATDQVVGILEQIRAATNAAVMVTEQGITGVEVGVERAQRAGDAIRTLAASIDESAAAAERIVGSARQQALGMEQIVGAMGSIRDATEQNVSGLRRTEAVARELAVVADALRRSAAGARAGAGWSKRGRESKDRDIRPYNP